MFSSARTRNLVAAAALIATSIAGLSLTRPIIVTAQADPQPACGTETTSQLTQLNSPDGHLHAVVSTDSTGKLYLSVNRDGRSILSLSRLGIGLSTGDIGSNLSLSGSLPASTTVTDDFYTFSGKRTHHVESGSQQLIPLIDSGDSMTMTLALRVYNDGVAYRYSLPGTGTVNVVAENSEFCVPGTNPSLQSAVDPTYDPQQDYESQFVNTASAGVPAQSYFPAMFQPTSQDYLLLTESGLYQAASEPYSAGRLALDSGIGNGHLFHLWWNGAPSGPLSTGLPLPASTPWRLLITGGLDSVVNSDLVDTLSDPSAVADTSWITPGFSAWDRNTSSTADNQETLQTAETLHLPWALFDYGWQGDSAINTTIASAHTHGVKVMVWDNSSNYTSGSVGTRMDTLLASYPGIDGLKLDFFNSDSQSTISLYQQLAAAAASRHLALIFHGSTVPRGLERTYPNVLSYEAVRGVEHYNAGSGPAPAPDQNTILAFTRNVVGPMDYTPGAFTYAAFPLRVEGAANTTTQGHELATLVAFESGITVLPGTYDITRYYPTIADYVSQLPRSWQQTVFLQGAPGASFGLARLGDNNKWYLSDITANASASSFSQSLSFLGTGTWTATVYNDGNDGTSGQACGNNPGTSTPEYGAGALCPQLIVKTTVTGLTASSTLSGIPIAADGGISIRFDQTS